MLSIGQLPSVLMHVRTFFFVRSVRIGILNITAYIFYACLHGRSIP